MTCLTCTALSRRLKGFIAQQSKFSAAHLSAVRHFIDQHAHARGQRPPIAVALPDDPRLPLSVKPQPLSDYHQLATRDESEPQP